MSWQDELKDLDAKLAAGSVSADDYRVARDALLRQADEGPAATRTGSPSTEETVDQPAQSSDPFAPPFRWKGTPEPERIEAEADQPSAETTQVEPHADAPPPSPGPSAPATQWGEAVEAPNIGWMMQGPAPFEKAPSTGKRTLGAAAAGVVVLSLTAGGIIYVVNRHDTSPIAGAQPISANPLRTPNTPPEPSTRVLPEPPAPRTAPADLTSAIVDPPGDVRDGGGPVDLPSLRGANLLPDAVVTALDQARMKDGLLKTTAPESTVTIGMFALTVQTEDDARAVALAFSRSQHDGGLPTNEDLSMRGVPVFSTSDKADEQVFRAVYVLYERVVIVETVGQDRAAVQQRFTELLAEQVDHAPPSLRTF